MLGKNPYMQAYLWKKKTGAQYYDTWRYELEKNVLPTVEDFAYHWGFQYRINKMHQEDFFHSFF